MILAQRAWRIKPEQVHDRRFFDMVPQSEHLTSTIKPLILRQFIPADVCLQFMEDNRLNAAEASVAPQGKKAAAIVRASYKNSKMVLNVKWGQVKDYYSPAVLKSAINQHWGQKGSYAWIPEFPDSVYTIYEKNTYCRNHLDVIIDEDGVLQRPTRLLTCLAYLNPWSMTEEQAGSFTGGELVFPSVVDEDDEPFTFRPTMGDIVLFPANPNYYHMVTRVTSGERHCLLNALRRA